MHRAFQGTLPIPKYALECAPVMDKCTPSMEKGTFMREYIIKNVWVPSECAQGFLGYALG